MSGYLITAIAHILMGRDESANESTKTGDLSLLALLSQDQRPYQCLAICSCDCDIISCSTFACQDYQVGPLGEPGACDLTFVFFY